MEVYTIGVNYKMEVARTMEYSAWVYLKNSSTNDYPYFFESIIGKEYNVGTHQNALSQRVECHPGQQN
jgi:hypothetical protein